jgi:hypothetical protein
MTMTRPTNMAGSSNCAGLAGHRRRMLPVLLLSYIGNLKLAIFFQRLRLGQTGHAGHTSAFSRWQVGDRIQLASSGPGGLLTLRDQASRRSSPASPGHHSATSEPEPSGYSVVQERNVSIALADTPELLVCE